LNQGAEVWFLVTGSGKAAAVRGTLSGSSDLPAAKVQPIDGRLIWFITQDAAPGVNTAQQITVNRNGSVCRPGREIHGFPFILL
jgi:hypothetical protein